MALSNQRIKALQTILKAEFGLDVSTEEAQQAGLAIMRFMVAKHRRESALPTEGNSDGKRIKTRRK